jgi:ribonuclease HII
MNFIVGIDEVGRGPLAGPVTVCCVLCSAENYKNLKKLNTLPPLGKDSKKLKEESREKYSNVLKKLKREGKINFSIQNISNKIIDSKGISFAIKKAIENGLRDLKPNPKTTKVLLDGGLKVGEDFKNQKTIIKGDEKEKIIAWASILAKVSRDSLMCKFSKKYSVYNFEKHKGYGTKYHKKAIKMHGFSDLHRLTFCKSI